MINSMVVNWERVDIQFCNSSRGLRDMMDAMGERDVENPTTVRRSNT